MYDQLEGKFTGLPILERELARVSDDHLFLRLARGSARLLYSGDDVHALKDLAEDDVLAVEPRCLNGGNKELRPVRVTPRVGHR